MISIIICSRKPDIPSELRQNIAETIGCEFELVIIDNSRNAYSIFSAYNEGVRKAKGDVLCFMHDDLSFCDSNWGTKISNVLSTYDSIGVVGLAGSHFLPQTPFYWWSSPFISEHNLTCGKECLNWMKADANIVDVVACDGMCLFLPRTIFEKIRFDEERYKGFHCYDMDICMQALNAGFRVCVTNEILVNHQWHEQYQNDDLDKWLEVFFNKWKDLLPIMRGLDEPQIVLDRINNLCLQSYDAKKARQSKAYHLGHFILHPISTFFKRK